MAGWLEFNDSPVRNCDEKCQGNCNFKDGCVCQKSAGHGNGMPAVMFDQAVLVLLRRLYGKNAIKPIPVSLGYNQSLDLYKLFCLVREKGGFESVSRGNLWGLVAKNMDLDFRIIASLKLVYFNKLADLDQWLDSIRKEWNSGNMSDGWGRNLELLSFELEKRISVLFGDDSGKVASKENLQIPTVKENNEFLANGNIANSSVDEKISENESPDLDSVESESKCKRKRESSEEMLTWLKETAKNPFQLSEMGMVNGSKWRGNGIKEYLPLALLMRVAMQKKKYSNPDGIHCCSHQFQNMQKQKIHPSMYDDPATCRLPGIRFSKRVPALLKSPKCPCCVSLETKQCTPENRAELEEDRSSTSSDQSDDSSPDKYPVQKRIRLGRKFQAEIPPLTGDTDSKFLGTRVWPPDNFTPISLKKGKLEKCGCPILGSVECVRFHTMENNMRLKRELGRAFYQWRFDRIGETVSLCWTQQEEEDFKSVMCVTPLSDGESYFPNKTRPELVDYYFNVFLQRRRSYQNRVTPNVIDSDDELSDFGSVGGLYGYVATRTSGENTGICTQNEECLDVGLNCEGDK